MSNAAWRISGVGHSIVLETSGGIVRPDAISVWEAEFSGMEEVSSFLVSKPSDDIPALSFSRYSIDPEIVVSGTLPGHTAIRIAGNVDGKYPGSILPGTDQLIADGTWYHVDRALINEIAALLSEKGIRVPGSVNVGQLIWLRCRKNLPVPVNDLTECAGAEVGLSSVALPDLRADLYPYQATGIAFLASVAKESLGCILADEMGLGKTLQVIALLTIEKKAGRGPSLVVCPATLLENWRREMLIFAPCLQVLVHSGPNRTGDPSFFSETDAVVTSYETATRDEPLLSEVSWNVVILDEAQNIKNPSAQRTLAVKGLRRRVSLAVTGTPVENRLTDLWSLSDFALPGLLGSMQDFTAGFEDTHEDASRLAPIIAPVLLRRRVADVAGDLPSRMDIPQAIPMTRSMARMYEEIRLETLQTCPKGAGLVVLGRLRQFCTHPALLEIPWNEPAEGMPKYARLVEILEELLETGEKALVFTSFQTMADIMIEDFGRRFRGIWKGFIDGRTPVTERQPMVDAFSGYAGGGLLVLNPRAAGTGLNITAANHVIHYNPEWNPALEDQASARAYRRKQTRPVTVHHLFFSDSVEEIITGRLSSKRKLASGAVVGHDGDTDAASIGRALQISPLSCLETLE